MFMIRHAAIDGSEIGFGIGRLVVMPGKPTVFKMSKDGNIKLCFFLAVDAKKVDDKNWKHTVMNCSVYAKYATVEMYNFVRELRPKEEVLFFGRIRRKNYESTDGRIVSAEDMIINFISSTTALMCMDADRLKRRAFNKMKREDIREIKESDVDQRTKTPKSIANDDFEGDDYDF